MELNVDRVLSIVSIVLGLFAAWYFYRKGKKEKEPYWNAANINLITDYISRYSGVEVRFKGEDVKTLSICYVSFWNNGDQTIYGNDLKTKDPLRIESTTKGEILEATLITESNKANEFNCKLDEGRGFVLVGFNFLDQGDAARFRIVHTGSHDSDIRVAGTIIGSKPIVRGDEVTVRRVKSLGYGIIIFTVTMLGFLVGILFTTVLPKFLDPSESLTWLDYLNLLVSTVLIWELGAKLLLAEMVPFLFNKRKLFNPKARARLYTWMDKIILVKPKNLDE